MVGSGVVVSTSTGCDAEADPACSVGAEVESVGLAHAVMNITSENNRVTIRFIDPLFKATNCGCLFRGDLITPNI